MNKKNFIKGTTLPVALFFTIATFAPAWGLQTASAAIEVVQQQSTIKGTVVDSQGEPIIGASVLAEGTSNGTITDIDGVWTDGGMYYTAEGDVMKRFSVKDGWGVIFLRELDIPVAIMTGENTQIVQKRADKLKIDYCYLGVKDKVEQAEELCRELGISLGEVAFIGDDLNDLPLLRLVGYSASPSNTPEYVKREVKYVTAAHGGYGAFREFVEKLLSDNGVLEKTVGKFL